MSLRQVFVDNKKGAPVSVCFKYSPNPLFNFLLHSPDSESKIRVIQSVVFFDQGMTPCYLKRSLSQFKTGTPWQTVVKHLVKHIKKIKKCNDYSIFHLSQRELAEITMAMEAETAKNPKNENFTVICNLLNQYEEIKKQIFANNIGMPICCGFVACNPYTQKPVMWLTTNLQHKTFCRMFEFTEKNDWLDFKIKSKSIVFTSKFAQLYKDCKFVSEFGKTGFLYWNWVLKPDFLQVLRNILQITWEDEEPMDFLSCNLKNSGCYTLYYLEKDDEEEMCTIEKYIDNSTNVGLSKRLPKTEISNDCISRLEYFSKSAENFISKVSPPVTCRELQRCTDIDYNPSRRQLIEQFSNYKPPSTSVDEKSTGKNFILFNLITWSIAEFNQFQKATNISVEDTYTRIVAINKGLSFNYDVNPEKWTLSTKIGEVLNFISKQ